jgi:hypothetical protein
MMLVLGTNGSLPQLFPEAGEAVAHLEAMDIENGEYCVMTRASDWLGSLLLLSVSFGLAVSVFAQLVCLSVHQVFPLSRKRACLSGRATASGRLMI